MNLNIQNYIFRIQKHQNVSTNLCRSHDAAV